MEDVPTRIKLCGLRSLADIEMANRLMPDYIGFVFAKRSRRYVSDEQAKILKDALRPGIQAVGVFVDANIDYVAELLECGIIDLAQLHGQEDDDYIKQLRKQSSKPLMKAFRMEKETELTVARSSAADYILLDGGAGDGESFDWNILSDFDRSFFLAGGLHPDNVALAVEKLRPYGVDVSSGIETDGRKDPAKMEAFVTAVRKADERSKT